MLSVSYFLGLVVKYTKIHTSYYIVLYTMHFEKDRIYFTEGHMVYANDRVFYAETIQFQASIVYCIRCYSESVGSRCQIYGQWRKPYGPLWNIYGPLRHTVSYTFNPYHIQYIIYLIYVPFFVIKIHLAIINNYFGISISRSCVWFSTRNDRFWKLSKIGRSFD